MVIRSSESLLLLFLLVALLSTVSFVEVLLLAIDDDALFGELSPSVGKCSSTNGGTTFGS